MTLHISVLGIDGSGKSTLTAVLPVILAAEFGVRAVAAGDRFLVSDAAEDHLAPGFQPEGLPPAARLSTVLKRLTKRVVHSRRLYPMVKLAQMLAQDQAARTLGARYNGDIVVSDGNTILSAAARAANYIRPASDPETASGKGPGPDDLRAVFRYVLHGDPIPRQNRDRLPDLTRARQAHRFLRAFRLHCAWLPDLVVFLDVSPRLAMDRIARRGAGMDRHENERDLAQARDMYLRVLEAYAGHCGLGRVLCVDGDRLSRSETIAAVVEGLRPHLEDLRSRPPEAGMPLGATRIELARGSVWRRVLNHRYLAGYLLRHLGEGSWREPLFAFSRPGRLFLKEGYSADVMRSIYERNDAASRFFDRAFFEYPLHRAVYDRLQILTRRIERELEGRLQQAPELAVFTAPSGCAYDLFRPLEALAARDPQSISRVRILASDLDPKGALDTELTRRAREIGVQFDFQRGDLTCGEMQRRLAAGGPYRIVLFVGLSSWIPKPDLVRHLRWIRENLHEDGVLITDSFTPRAFALSGRYAGYKAHYYDPDTYKALLEYCGFDSANALVESGRDGINHVVLVRPQPCGYTEKRHEPLSIQQSVTSSIARGAGRRDL
jgi:hypothetical protein